MIKIIQISLVTLTLLFCLDCGLSVSNSNSSQTKSSFNTALNSNLDSTAKKLVSNNSRNSEKDVSNSVPNTRNNKIEDSKLTSSKLSSREYQHWGSGHQAGYDWAERKGITDEYECGGKSQSFIEGCESYVRENNFDNDDSDDN